jgi:uncharacterized protein YvpB
MRAIFLLCLFLVGCNHIRDSYYSHPMSCVITDFPVLEQPDDISCGPTSAAMLLHYVGKDVSIEEVRVAAKTKWFSYRGRDIGMTSPECLASALSKYGISAKVKESNLSALKYYVSQGRLPIVLLRSNKYIWHYVIVTGYTETEIVIADPDGSHLQMTNDQFIGSWSYQTDMYGESVLSKCTSCNGKGRKLNLPFDKCAACQGTGKQDNWVTYVISMFNANPYTLIVPDTTLMNGK